MLFMSWVLLKVLSAFLRYWVFIRYWVLLRSWVLLRFWDWNSSAVNHSSHWDNLGWNKSYVSVNLGTQIHIRMTRAFKRVPTCHIGSAVHFHCTVAFKGHEATVSKMGSWTYVTCGYSFESSCHPGVDSGNCFNAHVSCWFHVSSNQCALESFCGTITVKQDLLYRASWVPISPSAV